MITDPLNSIQIQRSLKAFINNVVLHMMVTPTMMYQQAQSHLKWWDQLIQVTGGSLNHKKCCTITYHGNLTSLVSFNWIPWQLWKQRCSSATTSKPISILPLHEGTRYLGLYITSNYNTCPMEANLWQKAKTYTAAFQHTPMSCREAGVLYRLCFLPALTYPLLGTWLPDTFFIKWDITDPFQDAWFFP